MITEECTKFLRCPIDGVDMKLTDKSVGCASGHSFDVSKEGYIHMLVGKKRFLDGIGDNKEMLLARERFLGEGYYDFLSDEVNRLVLNYLKETNGKNKKEHGCILEVGSGTAFYLARLKRLLEEEPPQKNYCYFGTDISKEAVKFSAKKHKDISFLVADTYTGLPIKENSVKVLLNIFSPRNPSEFGRMLQGDGLLLTVVPNDEHLKELVGELDLLKVEEEKKEHISETFRGLFEKISEQNIEKEISMDSSLILDLVKMGPNYEYIDEQKVEKIEKMDERKVTVSFNMSLYRSAK